MTGLPDGLSAQLKVMLDNRLLNDALNDSANPLRLDRQSSSVAQQKWVATGLLIDLEPPHQRRRLRGLHGVHCIVFRTVCPLGPLESSDNLSTLVLASRRGAHSNGRPDVMHSKGDQRLLHGIKPTGKNRDFDVFGLRQGRKGL